MIVMHDQWMLTGIVRMANTTCLHHLRREDQDPSVTVQDLPDDQTKASMARLESQSCHKR